jgi:hypothetical protein
MTPRAALGELNLDFQEINTILTALAPYLLPEGCKVICERCNRPPRSDCPGYVYSMDEDRVPCPLRKATP